MTPKLEKYKLPEVQTVCHNGKRKKITAIDFNQKIIYFGTTGHRIDNQLDKIIDCRCEDESQCQKCEVRNEY